jgi:hypothetical protein
MALAVLGLLVMDHGEHAEARSGLGGERHR